MNLNSNSFNDSYLVAGDGVFLVVLLEFKNLIMVDLTDGWRVVKELNLHFRGDRLLLLVCIPSYLERLDHL